MRKGEWVLIPMVLMMVLAFLEGVIASNEAVSAFHQIYSALWYLMATVCLVGVCLAHMLLGLLDNSKAEVIELKSEAEAK